MRRHDRVAGKSNVPPARVRHRRIRRRRCLLQLQLQLGQSGFDFNSVDLVTRRRDAMIPRVVSIAAGGTVTFAIARSSRYYLRSRTEKSDIKG